MTNEKENRSIRLDQAETGESHVTGASTIEPVNDGHYHYPGPWKKAIVEIQEEQYSLPGKKSQYSSEQRHI